MSTADKFFVTAIVEDCCTLQISPDWST